MTITCIGCGKQPHELPEYIEHAEIEGVTPEEFVRVEEGTFNPDTGHFCCTPCYIDKGMPTSPTGWKAP